MPGKKGERERALAAAATKKKVAAARARAKAGGAGLGGGPWAWVVAGVVSAAAVYAALHSGAGGAEDGRGERPDAWNVPAAQPLGGKLAQQVPCAAGSYRPFKPRCHPKGEQCGRYIIDDLVPPETIDTILNMTQRGMASQPATGGPTIMDVNSGMMRGPKGLSEIYPDVTYTPEEYAAYASVFEAAAEQIKGDFGGAVQELYFSAPTFVTREVGNPAWQPAEIHDEYWHRHVDKDNTQHYDYSGLLYLSDFGRDFEGGRLAFYETVDGDDDDAADLIGTVEPRRGRFAYFSSGRENPHRVERVTAGTRFVMSMWFTCDERREFKTFLDGKVHRRFGEGGGDGAEEG